MQANKYEKLEIYLHAVNQERLDALNKYNTATREHGNEIAEKDAEIEQLKVVLYELTKITVTEEGNGDVCAYCEGFSLS